MLRYLSPEWLRAVGEAAESISADGAADVVVEQRVADTPEGDVVWHIVVESGRLAVEPGPASDPSVVFTQGYETAVAIATGAQAAREALLGGEVRLDGDALTLIDAQRAFAALERALAVLRDEVEY